MDDPASTPPPAPSAAQLALVLDLLKVLTPTQAIRDPALNHALAPFRGHPPTALLCGNATCREPFLWSAIDPLSARVRFSRSGPAGGAPVAGRQPPPFDRWAPEDGAGESMAPPGEPLLRWRFLCPRCRRPCVLSNRRMISLIARALAGGRSQVRPAVE
jgi:hypothetical protein